MKIKRSEIKQIVEEVLNEGTDVAALKDLKKRADKLIKGIGGSMPSQMTNALRDAIDDMLYFITGDDQ